MEQLDDGYARGIERLTEIVKRIHYSESANDKKYGPTQRKGALNKIFAELEKVVSLLELDHSEWLLEEFHNERGIHDRIRGERSWLSYRSIKCEMRELAESARQAAGQPPDPRKKHALSYAARGFLHLRTHYGRPLPTLYDAGQDLNEFKSLCESAVIMLSAERYRGALSAALATFDPFYVTGFEEIIFPQ